MMPSSEAKDFHETGASNAALHMELDRVRRMRTRRRRAGVAGLCLALLLGTAWLGVLAQRPASPGSQGAPELIAQNGGAEPMVDPIAPAEQPAPPDSAASSQPEADPVPRIVRIAGTGHTIERVRNRSVGGLVVADAVPRRVERISDAELLAAFDALGDPVGIVRMEGVTTLARLTPREESRTP